MWEVWDAPDIVISLGTLFAGVAAFWGACSAHRGVDAWKKEKESELAKDLADKAYQHRLALHHIRRPWATEEEIVEFDTPTPNTNMLHRRWLKSQEALDAVEGLLAQGDLRWGGEASQRYKPVRAISQEVISLIARLRRLQTRLELIPDDNPLRTEKRIELGEIIHQVQSELQDVFNEQDAMRRRIDDAFESIHQLLKDKL